MARKGGAADWALEKLTSFYEQIKIVNRSFCQRLRSVCLQDATINAVGGGKPPNQVDQQVLLVSMLRLADEVQVPEQRECHRFLCLAIEEHVAEPANGERRERQRNGLDQRGVLRTSAGRDELVHRLRHETTDRIGDARGRERHGRGHEVARRRVRLRLATPVDETGKERAIEQLASG